MSGCIEREMSKIILVLPTKNEHVEIFEQTVIGGISSVKTRLAFDSQILLPYQTIDDLTNRNFNYKIVYNLRMNNQEVKKRVITKIFKLDQKNQYGVVTRKP